MRHCPNDGCDYLIRFGRVCEFLDSVDTCTECGGELREGEAPPSPPAEYRELSTVYETNNRVQAHLVCSRLDAEGIPAYLSGDALQGAMGEIPLTMLSLRVQVP